MRLLGNGQGTPDQFVLPIIARHVDGDTWAHRLNFSVLYWAVRDAIGSPYMLSPVAKLEAIQYLLGPMPHAQAIGLSPSFIRELIAKAGAHLEALEAEAEGEASDYLADREARRAMALARRYEAHLKNC